jgi:hypothetical protein
VPAESKIGGKPQTEQIMNKQEIARLLAKTEELIRTELRIIAKIRRQSAQKGGAK